MDKQSDPDGHADAVAPEEESTRADTSSETQADAPSPEAEDPAEDERAYSANLQRCKDSADIAFQVIAHLAARGQQVDPDDYKAISKIYQYENFSASADAELRFWKAYSNVVGHLKPEEDAEGIYYTALFEMQQKGRLSGLASFHHDRLTQFSDTVRRLAVGILVCLVLLLAYGTIVSDLTGTISDLTDQRLALQRDNLEATALKDVPGLSCRPSQTAAVPLPCSQELSRLASKLGSTTETLHMFAPWTRLTGAAEEAETLVVFQSQIIAFLETYIYPLLAGALGACVSILRKIFAQLETKTLHLRIIREAYLRIAIGMIAGIVIGWVSVGADHTGISLAPLAMAFVAGYSVEIIYALLDRIVAAFTVPPAPAEDPRKPGGA